MEMCATVFTLENTPIISDNILNFCTKFENFKLFITLQKNNGVLLFTLPFTTLFSAFFLQH